VSAADAARVAPHSHCAQILAVLEDGQFHSSRELHRRVYCVLHSRIAELRRKGYRIEHRGGGAGAENHWYRWLKVTA